MMPFTGNALDHIISEIMERNMGAYLAAPNFPEKRLTVSVKTKRVDNGNIYKVINQAGSGFYVWFGAGLNGA